MAATAQPLMAFSTWGKSLPPALTHLKPNARVLALGDSLTAGYGANPTLSWPDRLAQLTGWQVVNKGVNGDTSAGALHRLKALLEADSYDAVLVGIGGNDMLRGISPQAIRDNLAAIVRESKMRTPYVAVIATPFPDPMEAASGTLADAAFYKEVAMNEKALLISNVYSHVLSNPALRSDPIHGNARGYAVMASGSRKN